MSLQNRVNVWMGLAALLVVALFYIPGMAAYSMWFDEVNMVENSLTLDMGEFYRIERQVYTSHPPLYFLLLKGWSQTAGTHDVALRALSVLPVLLTAAFVYRLGADFTGQPFGGLAAAWVLAGTDFLKLYAHTTHNYTWLVLLVAGLLFFYARYYGIPGGKDEARRGYLVGTAVFTLLLLYTHYYGVYVVLALNLHALTQRRRAYPGWFAGQAAAGLLFLPWLPVILRLASGDVNKFGDQDALLVNSIPTNLHAIPETFSALLYDGWVGYALLLGLGALGVLLLPRRGRWQVLGYIIGVAALSMFFALLGNHALRSYLPRRVIYLVIPVALLVGYGLAHLPRPARWALLLGLVLLTPTHPLPAGWQGNPFFRQGIEAIDAQPGDMALIYFSGELEARPLKYYAHKLLTIPYVLQFDNVVHVDNLGWSRGRIWALWADNAPFQLTQVMTERGYSLQETRRIGWYNLSRYAAPALERLPLATIFDPPRIFGEQIALLGYEIANDTAAPGDTVEIRLDWQAVRPLHDDLAVYVHLLDEDGAIAGQIDERPRHAGRELPAPYWLPGTTILDTHTVKLPTDIPPGVYTLRVGLYRYADAVRLTVDGGDGLTLGEIMVRAG